MADNSLQGGTDTIRDLDRVASGIKTQVMQLDMGGPAANAEVLLTGGQQTKAMSMPVVLPSDFAGIEDWPITGAGGQTALGQNILLAVAGTLPLDCLGMRSISFQIVPGAGTYTAGTVVWEQSNDGLSWDNHLTFDDYAQPGTFGGYAQVSGFIAGTSRFFGGGLTMRYLRARISVGLTGTGTGLQVFTKLSPVSYVPKGQAVYQNLSTAYMLVSGVVTNTPVSPYAVTNFFNSAASTNSTIIRASSTNLYSAVASNTGAAAAFVKLYTKSSAPVVGTDVPFLVIPVPANSVVSIPFGTLGFRCNPALSFAITNLAADTDTTPVAANQVKLTLSYL